jgi:D-amino-acid dehydrogenase
MGAAIAYELAREGMDVLVVDSGAEIGDGCSYANAGLLAPEHVEPLTTPANVRLGMKYILQPDGPFHIRLSWKLLPWLVRFLTHCGPRRARRLTASMRELARESVSIHRSYAADGLATGYRQSGSMDIYLTRKRFHAARDRVSTSEYTRVLTAAEARRRVPGLADVAGAIEHIEDAMCDTRAFVDATLGAARANGARLQLEAEVLELTGGARATGAITTRGTVCADHVVVAAGVSSGHLTSRFGLKIPLVGGKGYVVDVGAQHGPPLPVTFKELKVVVTPYPGHTRFCGTMDLGDGTSTIAQRRVDAILGAASRGLPRVDTSAPIEVWAGQRPCTVDGIPVIGRISHVPNLHLAAGHGMWGLVLAPLTGRAIAQAIVNDVTDPRLAPYSPDRFHNRRFKARRPGVPALPGRPLLRQG